MNGIDAEIREPLTADDRDTLAIYAELSSRHNPHTKLWHEFVATEAKLAALLQAARAVVDVDDAAGLHAMWCENNRLPSGPCDCSAPKALDDLRAALSAVEGV